MAAEGSRLEGVLASAKKRKDELEQQCQDKFDCPVSGLGQLIEEFDGVAKKELAQAESILGIAGEGSVVTEPNEVIIDDEEPVDQDDPDGPLV